MMAVLGLPCILLFGTSGGPAKKRMVRVSDLGICLGPNNHNCWSLEARNNRWLALALRSVSDDVGFWPYSVGLLVKFCSNFLSSLQLAFYC